MSKKTMGDEKRTDSDYIATDIAKVRMSGPADKARTITVPGDAPVDEVCRRAYLATRHVADYDSCHVGLINGRGLRHDGGLYEQTAPSWDADKEDYV